MTAAVNNLSHCTTLNAECFGKCFKLKIDVQIQCLLGVEMHLNAPSAAASQHPAAASAAKWKQVYLSFV